MHVVFVYPGHENLGIQYLSAVLRSAGHRTSLVFDPTLFDDAFFDMPALARFASVRRGVVDRILALEPDLVAIGVMTPTFPWALDVARRIRRSASVPIVLGGPHPTTAPERVLSNPEIDFIVRGEGEEAIVDLANALQAGRSVDSVLNLALRTGDGEVKVNPVRPLLADLDRLPFPDKSLFLREARLFSLGYAIMTERGCSYSCSFCHHYHGKKLYAVSNDRYVRRRSVGNVLDELHQALARFEPRMVRFEDETFTSDWPWVEEFCERYRREIGLPFFCLGRPDTIHLEMVKALKAAGCSEMELGVQSFDAGVRKRVAYRAESDEQIARTLRMCREVGLKLYVDLILNLPGQTETMLVEALDKLLQNPPAGVNAFFTSYYPGTAVLEIGRSMGLLSDAEVEAILDGKTRQRPMLGGHRAERSVAKLGWVLSMAPSLPPALLRWVVRDRRYRWLPYPGFTTAVVASAWISRASRWLRGIAGADDAPAPKFEAMRLPAKYVTYSVRRLWPRFASGIVDVEFRPARHQPTSGDQATVWAPLPLAEPLPVASA